MSLSRMNVSYKELDTVLENDTKYFGYFVDGEPIQKYAIHKLDVGVLPKLALKLRNTVFIEALDQNNT